MTRGSLWLTAKAYLLLCYHGLWLTLRVAGLLPSASGALFLVPGDQIPRLSAYDPLHDRALVLCPPFCPHGSVRRESCVSNRSSGGVLALL